MQRIILVGLREFFFTIIFLINNGHQSCLQLRILSLRLKDTPDYRFEMVIHRNNTMSSVSRVLKDVPVPIWNLAIVEYDSGRTAAGESKKNWFSLDSSTPNNASLTNGEFHQAKVLYNTTVKACEFFRYVKRIRLFNNVAQQVLSKNSGNLSLKCPMAAGTYVLKNIHVPENTGFLKFMAAPNAIYGLHGTVYSMQKDKSLEFKCKYEVNGSISRC